MSRRRQLVAASLLVALTTACTGSGSSSPAAGSSAGATASSGPLDVAAVWTGAERESFSAVLDAFTAKTGVPTRLSTTGDDVGAYLDVQVEQGTAPDVAVVPQVGLLTSLATRRLLRPLSPDAVRSVDTHQSPFWGALGTATGQRFGVVFKVANKSVWWYSPAALRRTGTAPPTTWEQTLRAAGQVGGSGTDFLSVGGADGWPLTDLFENLYLDSAGPQAYDRLVRREVPWTDDSVVQALRRLQALAEVPGGLAGGSAGTLATDFPASVAQVFGAAPTAATVFEGDFVVSVLRAAAPAAVAGRDYDFFPFPRSGTGPPPVVVGADLAAAMTDDPRSQQLLAFLATPEAGQAWARRGGFLSPALSLADADYPDGLTRRLAAQLRTAQAAGRVRFDLSDMPPTSFGATPGRGLYLRLQELVRGTPASDVAARLQADSLTAARGS